MPSLAQLGSETRGRLFGRSQQPRNTSPKARPWRSVLGCKRWHANCSLIGMTLRKRPVEASPLYALLSSIAATSLVGCSGRTDPNHSERDPFEDNSSVASSPTAGPKRHSIEAVSPATTAPNNDPTVLYCSDGAASRVHGLQAAYSYDSLAYYAGFTVHATMPPDFELVETSGTPCSTSAEREACEAEVEYARAHSASWWHYDDFYSSSWTLLLATSVKGPNPDALNREIEDWGHHAYVSRPLNASRPDVPEVEPPAPPSWDAGSGPHFDGGGAAAQSSDFRGDIDGGGISDETLPVVTIDDLGELQAFLGRIDTPNEAALIMFAHGRPITCNMEREGEDYIAQGEWMISDCPITTQRFELRVKPDGSFAQNKVGDPNESDVCVGRRPDGLCGSNPTSARDVCGRWLADVARLEAAAVVAFAWLEFDLTALGAPAELVQRARRAAKDELRHAELVAQLATARDASVPQVVVAGRAVRSALEVALENAVEGCVRESWGALCAHVQAQTAQSADVKAVWQSIARDETEHAQLSRDIATWLESQLSSSEREQVAAARALAIVALRRELDADVAPELVSELGLPSRHLALAQFDALTRAWLATDNQAPTWS